MGSVHILQTVTSLDLPPERVLANTPELESVVIIGYLPDGTEYFASSIADGGDVVWLLERCKLMLLRMSDP